VRAHLFPGHQIRLRGSVHTVTSWDVEEHKIIIKAGYWTHTATIAAQSITEVAGVVVSQTTPGTCATTAGGADRTAATNCGAAGTCATTAGGADRTAATDCGAANNAACNQQANCEASVTAPATWSATNNAACNQQANCEASVTAPATWTAGITVTGTLAADLTGAGMVTVSIISPIDYVFDNSNILTIGTNPLNAVAQANIVSVTHVETKSVPTSGEFQLCYANNCTNCIPWGSKGYVVSEQLVEFVPEITGVTTTLSVSTDATELEYRILFNGA